MLSGLLLSSCGNKDREEYNQACFDIADSMFTKNQFSNYTEYQKFKVQCKINTDEVYGKK